MKAELVKRRGLIVAVGLAVGLVNVALNAAVPADFARDTLPWMFAIAPMFVVGAMLIIRVPTSAVGWLLFAIALTGSMGTLQGFTAGAGLVAAIGASSSTFGIGLLPLLLLVFPDGSLLSRRWRVVAGVTLGTATLGGSLGLMVGGWGGDAAEALVFSPFYEATRSFTEAAVNVFFPLFAFSFLVALASMVVRYRRGSVEVRQQLKWLLAGVTLMAVASGLLIFGQSAQVAAGWQSILLAAGMASVPVAIGIAVLRYRLYDIDVVISKAVTYGALALFIGAVYVGIVVGIGELLGQGDRASFSLSIIATALVAMAFQPVSAVQRGANRVVYGERATPYEVLAQFSHRAADESDEDALRRIPRLIVDGTAATKAALWVRSGDGFRTAHTWPTEASARRIVGVEGFADPEADHAVPVLHDGELLGGISLLKGRGDSITPAEEELVAGLAGGIGLVLRNARLTARLRQQVEDLERSRDRVVTAADAARRSLERDLDSGPQQQLVALKVKLGPVRRKAEQAEAERTAQVLAQLETAAGEAIRAVRDFAGGIYPPLLEAEGVEVAVRQQIRKSELAVTVHSAGVGRYPRDVEAAVYFSILEALQNIAKYAGASAVEITLEGQDETLEFVVSDNGAGFDTATVRPGAGLANMADRLDTAGGSLNIESTPGVGTVVRGTIPLAHLVDA